MAYNDADAEEAVVLCQTWTKTKCVNIPEAVSEVITINGTEYLVYKP